MDGIFPLQGNFPPTPRSRLSQSVTVETIPSRLVNTVDKQWKSEPFCKYVPHNHVILHFRQIPSLRICREKPATQQPHAKCTQSARAVIPTVAKLRNKTATLFAAQPFAKDAADKKQSALEALLPWVLETVCLVEPLVQPFRLSDQRRALLLQTRHLFTDGPCVVINNHFQLDTGQRQEKLR